MLKSLLRICSILLVIVMVTNCLPLRTFAENLQSASADASVSDTVSTTARKEIVAENINKRTEYSKEYLLSNGLFMAVVYPDAVHYAEDGQWKEIDNTLKLSADGVYTNTAGVWDVYFPQQLSSSSNITITKDGYTLSFELAGQIISSGELTRAASSETLTVSGAQASAARVEAIDYTAQKAAAEYPETVSDKLRSRLTYSGVYQNTDVIYDLDSNKVKESILLERFNDKLRGYRYTLQVGSLIPVQDASGQILFYTPDKKDVVMAMPAPYLLDNDNAYNDDIQVTLTGSGSTYTLTYLLPRDWLAEEDRAWPVILDPVVEATISATNMQDQRVSENKTFSYTDYVLEAGYDVNYGITRSYLKYNNLPALTSSDVVVGATLQMCQPVERKDPDMTLCIQVHKVTGTWNSQTITWANKPAYTEAVEDYYFVKGTPGYYGWVITDIVRSWYADGNNGLMIKATDAVEAAGADNWMQFFSSDSDYKPVLSVIFRNNNGLESYWDYTASSAGRAGTGYVNNFTGNLVWVHSDLSFGGNRMPVSINHIYNANDALSVADSNNSNDTGANFFGLGCGWRTNFHQRLYKWDVNTAYYIWEDADGTDHYFKADEDGKYKDEDGLELELTVGSDGESKYILTDKKGNTSHFDTSGRLRKQQNNQATKSSIIITYTTDTGPQISTITDGAGRVYAFTYSNSNNLLTRISYKGNGTTELSYVSFEYTGSNLTKINDKDGKASAFCYTGNLLISATDIDGYQLTYAYNTPSEIWQPYRVMKVSESDGTAQGGELTISYAYNQTTFTDHNDNVEIVQFNDFGNTVSVQDDEGHASFAQYALNTDEQKQNNTDATKKGNQLRLSSKLQNTVGNVIRDSGFELSTVWYNSDSSIGNHNPDNATIVYSGRHSLYIYRGNTNGAGYIYTDSFYVAPGETYTFSGYVCNGPSSVYLALSDGTTTVTSEILAPQNYWVRLEVAYTNNTGSYQYLTPQMYSTNTGYLFLDCVQVEKASTASRYNLIENGDFRYGLQGWSLDSLTGTDGTVTTVDPAPAKELENTVAQLTGNPETVKHIYQRVMVSGAAGDTFILSGWAKGDSVPLLENTGRDIGLYFCFNYTDGSWKTFEFHFNPDTDSQNNWQYGAWAAVATKDYTSVNVDIRYDYNMNTAWFDGIQLYKEAFGSSYTYDEDGNVISVVDLQKQETTYWYTENKLTRQVLPSGSYMVYEYDDYHNVILAGTDEEVWYSFTYDTYGNNTQVSASFGSQKIVASATYSNAGNTLAITTDTLGNVTTYQYNANTNVQEWAKYPENTDATRTNYTYDQMYRMVSAAAVTDSNLNQSAIYTYTNDLLSKLQTPSTAYTFTYGDFGLLQSVDVGVHQDGVGWNLATYHYTDDRNHYLEELDYGNGDSIEYTYDKKGRVTKETYEDGATVTYLYDNNGALATMTDSETGIKTTYYYDFTDRTMKYVESGNGYSHSVGYEYDRRNNMTAMVETINGIKHTTSYTYDYDNIPLTTTNGASQKVNNYDGLDRVTSSATKHNGNTIITDEWYYDGNGSDGTSRLPNACTQYLNGLTVTDIYNYDKNGNIVFVEGSQGFIHYTYDSANQLIREDNEITGKTKTWTYDAAGNILTRSEYPYTRPYDELGTPTYTTYYSYEEPFLPDYLSYYDNVGTIGMDVIGNPIYTYDFATDVEWRYTWKHGRQLSTLSDGTTTWSYTYNADGLRTKKTDGTTTYNYVYSGSKLTQMTVDSNTLYISYDAGGQPFTLNYNGSVYYYVLNMLGDVTGIANSAGSLVVKYWYDAWGYAESCTGSMAATLGTLNPLRYRSYVYDQETGFYYVSSRYYDPEIGRWISPEPNVYNGEFDEGAGLVGYNVYAYCANNPVNNIDPTGEFVISTAVLIGIGIGDLIGGTAGGVYGYKKAVKNNVAKQDRWKYVVGYGLGGAVVGGVIGGFVGYGAGVALGAKASSGLVVKSISKALSSVSRNTMHHIMQSKHAWGQVLKRATWNNVKSLINTTMQKGATTLINKQGNALIYEAVRNNIVVRYAVIDGIIKISDAWVKTR